MRVDDRERDRRLGAGRRRRLAQAGERQADRVAGRLLGLARGEEPIDHLAERAGPRGRRPRHGELLAEREGALRERGEHARGARLGTLDVVERQDPVDERVVVAAPRVAEEQPIEAEAPRVLGRGGQLERRARGGVHAPADPRGAHPLAGDREVGLREAEAAADGVHVEEREQPTRLVAAPGQREEIEERAHHRAVGAERPVGHGERNGALARRRPEDGVDRGRVRLDVGRHHHHVGGAERRIGVEERQQLIVQHLDLAERAVAGVELDRAVLGRRGRRRCVPAERQHVALQPLENGRRRRSHERLVDLEADPLAHQVDELAPLLPERREQRMPDLQVRVARRRGRAARQLRLGHDVAPVLAARVHHIEADVGALAQPREDLEPRRRHGGDTEYGDARRQRGDVDTAGVARRDERVEPVHAVAIGRAGGDPPPELRLPVRVAPHLPAPDPLRSIDEILIEDVRDPAPELVAPPVVAVAQVGGQLREAGRVLEPSQDLHEPPRRDRGLEARALPFGTEHAIERLPHEGGGEREPHARSGAGASAPCPRSGRPPRRS